MPTFEALRAEYALNWTRMSVLPNKVGIVDATARRLLRGLPTYAPVSVVTGVPSQVIMVINERESGGSLKANLAQGDPLDDYSVHIPVGEPKGLGHGPPFSFQEAAVRALQIDRLDKVQDWSVARALFQMELYNGFGYRGHGIRSPYLYGGTNLQQRGKYVKDNVFDPEVMDVQLGVAPLLRRIAELEPSLRLPLGIEDAPPLPAPVGNQTGRDAWWIQRAVNALPVEVGGADPRIAVDGSYGRRTRYAVGEFQEKNGLTIDGLAGPKTIRRLEDRLLEEHITAIASGPTAPGIVSGPAA